jgi:hypothetical protein
MKEKTVARGQNPRCRYFPYNHQRDTEYNSGYGRYGAYVRYLAQPARRFILSIRVLVRRYLQQKY